MVLNSSGNRTNSNITEIGVKYPKERRTPYKWNINALRAFNRQKFRLPSTITGAVMLPWSVLTDKEKGIDLRGAQVGDVKTAYTVAVGSGTLHELHYAFG